MEDTAAQVKRTSLKDSEEGKERRRRAENVH
jgi:hypothetical protein